MFKKAAITMILACLALSATFAAPAKNELSVGAEFLNANDANSVWAANLNLLFPLGSGYLKLGPEVAVGSLTEANRIGARLEFNIFKDAAVTPFVGASYGYFQKPVDGLDRDVTTGFGGLKFRIAKSGFVKVYVTEPISGRGADTTDVAGAAACVLLF